MANEMERDQAEERAILDAWTWLLRCQNKGVDVSFASVVARVRERCPGADSNRIWSEFEKRLRRRVRVR